MTTQAYENIHAGYTAFFDRSNVGKVKLTGPDAVNFLHNLITNDLKNLAVGGGCEAYFCERRAKVLHQLWVQRQIDGLWLETTIARSPALMKELDRFLISEQVEINDVTNDYCQFHLTGSDCAIHLQKLFETMPAIQEFCFAELPLKANPNVTVKITSRNLFQTGFDLTAKITGHAELRQALNILAIPEGTPADYETLRIENAQPEYGQEIDENRFVMILPRVKRAVSYSKGCFPGQEPIVMARDLAGHVNRALMTMKVSGDNALSKGTVLSFEGAEIGDITSSIYSPYQKSVIAIGYVKRGKQTPGLIAKAGDADVELLNLVGQ